MSCQSKRGGCDRGDGLTFSLEDSDSQLLEIILKVFTISTILGWVTLGLFFFFYLKKNTQPIEKLKKAIKLLQTKKDSSTMIEVDSTDEIGEVANDFNSYLQSINMVLNEDKAVIHEAKLVIDQVKHGCYSNTINATTSNETLEEFKNSVNEMILSTQQHFTNINKILDKYVHYDYREKIKINGLEQGTVFEAIIQDINALRDSITAMLLQNQSNGTSLEVSSTTLLENVQTLSSNSTQAAAALEETAAALEQITTNISNNTNTIIKMSQFASNVTQSAAKGKELATHTTDAMTQIDQEVNAINEAITVIDQIAFQTNILSLNAAVEAATAGEAGRGFAVVAQEVRNLASRSADAANEIKKLVENATTKADDGKKIADEMISGYTQLNEDILQTIDLIKDVEMASKEQLTGIEQINNAVTNLDRQTQQNASIASQTQNVAMDTDTIAKSIVSEVDTKEFIGKESNV